MREIDDALDGELDYLFVATSTTGTLRGCCDYLRDAGRETGVVAVDALGSVLFGGTRGARRLPGFGAGVETSLSKGGRFDRLMRVSDLDCVIGCRRLVAREAHLRGGVLGRGRDGGGVARAPSAAGSALRDDLPRRRRGLPRTVYDDAWVARELGVDRRAAALVAGSVDRALRAA